MTDEIEFLKTSIAKELRKKRGELNLSKADVIKGINHNNVKLDYATLTRYETGETLQSLDKLCIILKFYNLNLKNFFNEIFENFHRNELTQELDELSDELDKEGS